MTEPGPILSPDGKHRWDGQGWVPTYAPPAAQPWYATSIRDRRRRSVRAQVIFATVLGLFLLMTLGAIASLAEAQRTSDFGDAQQNAYCADRGYTPAECAR